MPPPHNCFFTYTFKVGIADSTAMKHALHTPYATVSALATRLEGGARDYDALLAMAAGKRYVLLGEATHGTREFYRMRADITQRLIDELGFDTIAIEGDWPDTARVNRFILGESAEDAAAALGDFERFPEWMWRNREMQDFIVGLRHHNAGTAATPKTAIFGLDLYSLYRSADAVIRYLDRVDPQQAQLARVRYARLDHVREAQSYGHDVARALRPSAEEDVLLQLQELQQNAPAYLERYSREHNDPGAADAQFLAERNATIVVNAEHYYRAMYGSRINTWNLRDSHMHATLNTLASHRQDQGGSGRVVVWAHNSHLGDARATDMHLHGEWNLGQLVREAEGDAALLVGFTTYTGYVSAASDWDGPVEHKHVRPARAGSYEHLFHSTHLDRFFLPLTGPAALPLRDRMLERAIGVIYRPGTERASHYFHAALAAQFDAVFHLDETEAVEPLAAPAHWHHREAAETYPFGL